MIALILKDVPYEQDIRELLMEFFPGEEYSYEENAGEGLRLYGLYTEGTYAFSIKNSERDYFFEAKEHSSRFLTKSDIKRELYKTLKEMTGKDVPWGTLTGIRPTKLALTALDRGETAENIKRKLADDFYLSDEKADLCVSVAGTEQSVLDANNVRDGFSLYIGIPFCPTTCSYCSFTSYPIGIWKDRTDDYVAAVIKEIEAVSDLSEGQRLQTVYMGGGTPTSLSSSQLERIINAVNEKWDRNSIKEFTVEAGRPDSITLDKLETLKKLGINRISVNPQSMNQKTLDLIGRRHTVDEVIEKYHMAREAGFDNINMDIIIGLPGEGTDEIRHTMDVLEDLNPDDITVHSLAIKRAARMGSDPTERSSTSYDTVTGMMVLASERCRKLGLHPYYMYRQKNMAGNFENVAYCRPGKECLYNILIMEEIHTIVGCGAGCSTKIALGSDIGIKRIENVKDPGLYIERLDEMIERKQEIWH